MIYTANEKREYNVTTLLADIGVRYWEDGVVNGVEDNDDNPQMPLIQDGRWVLRIDLASGVIAGWPQGIVASVHYKVCDDGNYRLLDNQGNTVTARLSCYVPSMLSPKDDGFGDYVIMDIDEEGKIDQWKADMSYFERDNG